MDERLQCPHADRCAGCPAIDLAYGDQLAAKAARLQRAIDRYPILAELASIGVTPAEPTSAYRARAKLVAARGALGLYAKRGDHVLVDIPECRVLAPSLARAAAAVRARSIPGLRAVDLREAVDLGGRSVPLITLIGDARQLEAPARALADELEASVAIASSREGTPQLLGRDLRVVRGESAIADRIDDRVYALAAHGAFVQVHRAQAARIYHELADALARALGSLDGTRVADAFAGSGAIGLVLAARGARVLAIESFAPAAELAHRAAREQRLSLEAAPADASTELARRAAASERFDAIALDPPRRGLSPELRRACAELAPRAIAYLSCEPETFARDLDHFARLGYRVAHRAAYDLMPQTDEVEAFALLIAGEPAPVRILHRGDRLVAADKPAHEPTTPQDGRVRSLLDRVRALPGLGDAVPLHRLDAGTSGVCLFAVRAEYANDLANSISDKHYLALCRGIAREKGTIARALRESGRLVPARTRYSRVRITAHHSLLDVRLETGRTHQIRRHLASIGHPVLGDERHGDRASNRHFLERHGLDRPFLHCARMQVGSLSIESPLPGELAAVLASCDGRVTDK